MAAPGRTAAVPFLAVVLAGVAFAGVLVCAEGYERPGPRDSVFVRRLEETDPAAPEQVHVSLVGPDKMRISWITAGATPTVVDYGTSPGSYQGSATGETSSYDYLLYHSGLIHDVVIGPLEPDTVYYYRCGSFLDREFSLKTPPSSLPVKLAVVGDLGQTQWTTSTLQHIEKSGYDLLILPGDLSYADFYQPWWDSFGQLVEPLASQRPWMVTQGNHEIEKIPLIHSSSFTAYNTRWRMPYEQSGSNSNLYYSFDVAGSVHVIMLGSYTDFDQGSPQFRWLQSDLSKVDRGRTPWVVVIVHAPWYNTNLAHQGERESIKMKACMEELLYQARVDVVFAGHIHAYERFTRVFNGRADSCGPMHITIGDGGNREGLANGFKTPAPKESMFREASFGHGQLEVVNTSHARWCWHRNDNDESVIADSIWITSLSGEPSCKP
ncbi:hypothetical protein MLD38_035515 [Melastoma candidum]|uniref:Uncharacterized protein n=1 Tax=Melastoma candidum TaxID=119954 RepID=A0ACB9LH54_9MYRT|nr:hypothetical protein MLD38_035515 [Melastoma candidum]